MKLKNLLIANPENNYRPWIVTKTAMACFVLSIWTLRLFLPGYIATGAPGMDAADLMNRINTERTNRLLPALITNSKLTSAATAKSQDMIDRDYFAHVDPDGNYAWPLVESYGYKPYKSLGENLAVDFTSAAAVVNAWMNSPGHRANILSEKYEDQGMAAIMGEFENHDTYLITNIFGTLMQPVQPTPAPTPVPAQAQEPASSPSTAQPATLPATSQPLASTAAAVPEQTPVLKNTETPNPETATTEPAPTVSESLTPQPLPVTNASIPSEKEDLQSLKIVIAVFAGLYTFFLAIDSYIIHLARVRREHISSSPHAVLMLLISVVNFLTLWI